MNITQVNMLNRIENRKNCRCDSRSEYDVEFGHFMLFLLLLIFAEGSEEILHRLV